MAIHALESRRRPRASVAAALAALAGAALLLATGAAQERTRVSRFGEYSGYTEPVYDEWVRTSSYVTVRDGTKLAADVVRPAVGGKPVETPLPVVWTHDRYHRAILRGGTLISKDMTIPPLRGLLRHGYVIAAVDVRGTGASFGTWRGLFSDEEARDAYDVTEWLASQPWCDENVGMFGGSYLGITQYTAAGECPPHLKAIYPVAAMFDKYSTIRPGGIYASDLCESWSGLVQRLPSLAPVARVDEDRDGAILAAAEREHAKNTVIDRFLAPLSFRDSRDAATGIRPYLDWNPAARVPGVKKSRVAISHQGGWLDVFARDTFLWYRNLDNPQRLVMGPWNHQESFGPFAEAEHLRWFDHWLKGVENGVMDEPPIRYYTAGAPEGNAWRTARAWPLPEERRTRFYFSAGPSGSARSKNDGFLLAEAPRGDEGSDSRTVDYAATSGKPSRWSNAYGDGGVGALYPDMAENDARGFTYTTPPLAAGVEVTGHPVVSLWVRSSAPDGDFFAYLEEITPDGVSHYVTEGCLRASLRAIGSPPFDVAGVPFHAAEEKAAVPLAAGEAAELRFDLIPLSNVFDAGHRIRLTVTGADRDNFRTNEIDPPPTVTVHRGARHPSYVELPVIPARPAKD